MKLCSLNSLYGEEACPFVGTVYIMKTEKNGEDATHLLLQCSFTSGLKFLQHVPHQLGYAKDY